MSRIDYLIVHVTATPPHMDQVDAHWIDAAHRRRGFRKGGYHELITRPGYKDGGAMIQNAAMGYPLRHENEVPAAVGDCGRGWNARTWNVSLAGGVDARNRPEDNMTVEQYDLLKQVIAQRTAQFGIPMSNVIGHRDLIKMTDAPPKACPCFSVQEWLQGARTGMSFSAGGTLPPSGHLALPTSHKVRRGETLWGISRTFGVPLEDILSLNAEDTGVTGDRIRPGQTIRLR